MFTERMRGEINGIRRKADAFNSVERLSENTSRKSSNEALVCITSSLRIPPVLR